MPRKKRINAIFLNQNSVNIVFFWTSSKNDNTLVKCFAQEIILSKTIQLENSRNNGGRVQGIEWFSFCSYFCEISTPPGFHTPSLPPSRAMLKYPKSSITKPEIEQKDENVMHCTNKKDSGSKCCGNFDLSLKTGCILVISTEVILFLIWKQIKFFWFFEFICFSNKIYHFAQ